MMTLPMESSLVDAPTIAMALGLKSASNILFPLLKLFDKGLYVGLGLFIRNAAQVVQVAGDDQSGDACCGLDALGHAVPVVGVAGAGLGIVVDDSVDAEL